ncbi:MAG: hypothetical protein KJ587_16930 [Alphaproteobacteria bacterium]|nr:hypothetical protein [Alphaproteobacteria bacterium]
MPKQAHTVSACADLDPEASVVCSDTMKPPSEAGSVQRSIRVDALKLRKIDAFDCTSSEQLIAIYKDGYEWRRQLFSGIGDRRGTQFAPMRSESRLDPLTERRAEQGRQLAIAATRADHHRKVSAAVAAFVDFTNQSGVNPTTSLPGAQKAYSEF